MSRMVLLECSAPHWIPVVQKLQGQGACPVLWTAWHRMRSDVAAAFPSCEFIDTIHAKRALGPDGGDWVRSSFDGVCAAVYERECALLFDMMNRFDTSRDFHHVDRSVLMYQLLMYWRDKLDKVRPDLVIFPAPPHVVYDYVVLSLCRELKIHTLMFEEATIVPPYRVEMTDYLIGDMKLEREVSQVTTISSQATDIADRLRGTYREAKPTREIEAHARRDEAERDGIEGLMRQIEVVFEIEQKHGGCYSEQNPKVVNVSSLEKEKDVPLRSSFDGRFANTRHLLQQVESRLRTSQYRQLYDALSIPLSDISGPFIYAPIAGQPERTSNPQAGIFANQLLMLNILSTSMPDGWRLVVKEHPNQFHPLFAVNMCRSEEYYLEMASLPNVSIVAPDADPFDLIDQCSIVATTGGTSALEAVARRKPALLFGDAWYRACPGITRIRSAEAARRFFESWPVSVPSAGIERFVEAVIRVCPEGIADYPPEGYPMDDGRNIENLVRSVGDALSGAKLCS